MNNNIKLGVKLLKYQARESDSKADSQMAADFMQSQKIYILKVFRHFKNSLISLSLVKTILSSSKSYHIRSHTAVHQDDKLSWNVKDFCCRKKKAAGICIDAGHVKTFPFKLFVWMFGKESLI